MHNEAQPTLVVGVGASAGGLEACKELFLDFPTDTGMAFVVVLHLDPTHSSHVAEILQMRSELTMVQAMGRQQMHPNHVYVIAPDTELTLRDGMLHAEPLKRQQARGALIDALFSSLAEAHGERATGIILSETGADGSIGAKRIRAAGGLCLVQDPQSTVHDGMPRAAINAGVVDSVLTLAAMAPVLCDFAAKGTRPEMAECAQDTELSTSFERILMLLGSRFDVDFSAYKEGTLQRRTERRMGLHNFQDWAAYLDHLRGDADELVALYQDLLIGVTGFFRDPEVWTYLAGEFPALLGRRDGGAVRAWVAGCATGEEAYSLAIMLFEQLAGSTQSRPQIYATDLSSVALATARRGVYPDAVGADIGEERLQQFFRQNDGQLQIDSRIRESLTFARHNVVAAAAPFSKMDIVTCRNLMIYLKPFEQDRLLERLHFALNPSGLLLLGHSETVARRTRLFDHVSKPHGIYRAHPANSDAYQLSHQVTPAQNLQRASLLVREPDEPSAHRRIEQYVLGQHTPACVVINQALEIEHFIGATTDYMTAPTGPTRMDLLSWVRPGFYAGLHGALERAAKEQRTITIEGRVHRDGDARQVRCMIESIPSTVGEAGLMLAKFSEVEGQVPAPVETPEADEPFVRQLEAELLYARRELQGSIEQLESMGEEYRAGQDELLSLNEELQSTNEELQGSKEELQSLNEELTTVNRELEDKNAELLSVNQDLDNLFSSTGVPTIFLDPALKVRRFTEAATQVLSLVSSDIGRSIEHIKTRFDNGSLATDAVAVLETLDTCVTQVETEDGKIFVRETIPYRSDKGGVDGVCITFRDITEQHRARIVSETDRAYAEAIVRTVRTPLIILDDSLRIVSVNQAFFDILQETTEVLAGRRIYDIDARLWNVLDLRELLEKVLPDQREVIDFEIVTQGRVLLANAYRMLQPNQQPRILMSIEDVTERKHAKDAAQQRLRELTREAERKNEWIAMLGHELRNPLAAVANGLDLLDQMASDDSGDKTLKMRDMMRNNVQRLKGRLDELLDAARIISGKLDVVVEPADLAVVTQDVVDALAPHIERQQQQVSVSLPSAWVLGDAIRLTEIVENLLDNAMKFTPAGGRIRLIIDVDDANSASLTVRDTGIGMAPELIDEIFDLFSQGPRALDRKEKGLGLGLPLVRKFVELYGGQVEAFSAGADQGSEFVVTLPRIQPSTKRETPRAPVAVAVQRILIVDDEPDAATALVHILQRQGHEAEHVLDGWAALQLAAIFEPHVVLLDLGLPEMDGYEVAKQLRAQHHNCLIVALTGYQKDEARLQDAGFDHHLTKPLDLQALDDFIKRLEI